MSSNLFIFSMLSILGATSNHIPLKYMWTLTRKVTIGVLSPLHKSRETPSPPYLLKVETKVEPHE